MLKALNAYVSAGFQHYTAFSGNWQYSSSDSMLILNSFYKLVVLWIVTQTESLVWQLIYC